MVNPILIEKLSEILKPGYKSRVIRNITAWMRDLGYTEGEIRRTVRELMGYSVKPNTKGVTDPKEGLYSVAKSVYGDPDKASRFLLEVGWLLGEYRNYAGLDRYVRYRE